MALPHQQALGHERKDLELVSTQLARRGNESLVGAHGPPVVLVLVAVPVVVAATAGDAG